MTANTTLCLHVAACAVAAVAGIAVAGETVAPPAGASYED